MAARDTGCRKVTAGNSAMGLQRLQGINRAGGFKPAGGAQPWAQENTVRLDDTYEQ